MLHLVHLDERISRPGGEVHGTHSVWSLCARSRADIRYISYTTLYGTPCALVRVLYVRGYSRSKVFGSRIVGTCVGSNRARLRSLSSSCSSPHEPWMLETHVETSFLVSAVAVERNARAMKRSLLTPQSSWPVDVGPRLHSSYALRTGARRPMSDVRGMRPCGNPLGPGGKECVQRAPNRDPRTRENRGRKRRPLRSNSKIRTNSDQSKLSHTSQFTVIECPFACPIPYIYVLHPASTTPRIPPTMHYALRTHYSLTTVPPLPPLPTLPPLPPLQPLPHLHTASSKCVPQLEMAPHSYCLHASAIHALSIWWNC